jgi:tetratricopeptide (TPR) repeat protein
MQDDWFNHRLVLGMGTLFLVWGCITGHPEPEDQRTTAAIEAPAPNSYYYYTEAQILKNRGDTNAAQKLMQQAIESDPEDLFVRRELATLYLMNKKEKEALELLQGILQDAPGDVPTLLILGRIYQNDKDLERAKAIYEEVLEQDPDNEDIYLLLGNLYMNDAQWDEAFEVFERLTTRFPGA